jgi:signal transduction histidine kinase
VLTRTLTSISESELDGRTIEEHELLFTPEDAVRPRANARVATRGPDRTAEKSPEPQRPVGRIERTGSSLVFRGPETARRSEPDAARQAEPIRAPESDPHRSRPFVRAIESPSRSEDASDTFERVVASLAHDLRNPMTAIQTFAHVIAAGRESADSAKELGALASDACSRLEGALEALQKYGSFGVPSPEPLDVAELARSVVAEDAEHASQASLGATEPFEVRADAAQLRFVVENLLAAALAEAGESGRVVIRTEREALVLSVPAARGAVAKLHRLSERQPVSWRIVLARAIAARNGFDVDVEGLADGMTIRCRPSGGEGGARGQ